MSHLTVTEKEHWKKRIENRIDKAIEALETKDASLMPKLKAKAATEAHVSLGIADFQNKIKAITDQHNMLENEKDKLKSSMYAQLLGEEAVRNGIHYRHDSDFLTMVRKRTESIESELLKNSAIGREILKLRHEKEALLDTVWLASSNLQIRDLWSRVSAVLGDDATPLQQQVLATETASS